jgi:hypothetical protein
MYTRSGNCYVSCILGTVMFYMTWELWSSCYHYHPHSINLTIHSITLKHIIKMSKITLNSSEDAISYLYTHSSHTLAHPSTSFTHTNQPKKSNGKSVTPIITLDGVQFNIGAETTLYDLVFIVIVFYTMRFIYKLRNNN